MTLREQKQRLRRAVLARRGALDAGRRADAASHLVGLFERERPFALPAVVSGFWPINEEIDVRPLMQHLAAAGCTLALPVVVAKRTPLVFRAWRPGEELEAGVFGTRQPAATQPAVEPDALLVPLLACDREGWRLGYGGGFYDRTLAGLRRRKPITAVGVAFDLQVVDAVPRGPEDQRLDWLLTERRASAFV